MKILINPLKAFPSIGQPLTRKDENRTGYYLTKFYYGDTLLVDMYSPTAKCEVATTYLQLCKLFTWEGDDKQPNYYEA